MSLTASDLRSPTGEVDAALFYPGASDTDVNASLAAYLAQGYAKATALDITDSATADALARSWSYYRAWSDVVRRITLAPASASLAGEVSTTRLQSQINEWILERDRWLAAYEALIPGAGAAPTKGVTVSARTEIVF